MPALIQNPLKRLLLLQVLMAIVSVSAFAQTQDPLILRAMKDELKRNMTELSLEGHEKPFFISYTVTDQREISINASLGAVVRSNEYPMRTKNVRVLVGDYNFNDESLDMGRGHNPGDDNNIAMPVDDDYFGIRRALWATTDAVYRAAARTYKDNVNFLQEQKKALADVPHRSFAKVPVTRLTATGPKNTMNRAKLEDLARELSLIFQDYPDIGNSNVIVRCHHTQYYFVNSEGTETITTDNGATIAINAQTKTPDGEIIFDQGIYTAQTTDKLPAPAVLAREVRDMADRLMSLKKTQVFKDSYTGPVLFIGPAAVDVFTNSFGETFVASKSIANTYADAKVGKKILDGRFTVKSMPKLKSFNNTELLGAYDVDDEGVVPPDELVLVEDGILRNQMNDRTVIKEGQGSNGHGSGAGVIAISSATGEPVARLKEQLIEKAKEEGLDYALIVRHFSSGGIRALNTYTVSLADGQEELVRSANVRSINLKTLKRVLGVSNEQIVRNVDTGQYGAPLSIIAPSALLLEEVEVEGSRNNPYPDKDTYVENPVKQKSLNK